MAKADNNQLLLFGGLAVAGYFAYKHFNPDEDAVSVDPLTGQPITTLPATGGGGGVTAPTAPLTGQPSIWSAPPISGGGSGSNTVYTPYGPVQTSNFDQTSNAPGGDRTQLPQALEAKTKYDKIVGEMAKVQPELAKYQQAIAKENGDYQAAKGTYVSEIARQQAIHDSLAPENRPPYAAWLATAKADLASIESRHASAQQQFQQAIAEINARVPVWQQNLAAIRQFYQQLTGVLLA